MNKADKYFIRNLNKILKKGVYDENPRAKYIDGTPAHSKFITMVYEEYNLEKGEFPITTLRNTAIKTGIKEILWIYQKQTSSLEVARDMGIKWWDEWDIGNGTIGQRYGETLKRHNLVDDTLNGLINQPFSRRHIINMYQYADLKETNGLFPCAYEILFSIRKTKNKNLLDMTLVQRSSDYLVANYINKTQYVGLQMMFAGHCGYEVGKFGHLVQNLHIYDRHEEALLEILNKKPLKHQPIIHLKENKNFYDYNTNDFEIFGVDGITRINSNLELAI
jgi:thymidylate synthase